MVINRRSCEAYKLEFFWLVDSLVYTSHVVFNWVGPTLLDFRLSVCTFPYLNANNFWNNWDTKIIKIVPESENWSESNISKFYQIAKFETWRYNKTKNSSEISSPSRVQKHTILPKTHNLKFFFNYSMYL